MIAVIFIGPKAYVNGVGYVWARGLEATRLCVDRKADLGAEDRQLLFWVLFLPSYPYLRACDRTSFLPTPTLEAFFKICCASVSHVFQIRIPFNGFLLWVGLPMKILQDFTIQCWEGMGSFVVTILLRIASEAMEPETPILGRMLIALTLSFLRGGDQ